LGLLEGKVAIVTGGGQGVGEGIALALGAEGAAVVIADKNADTAERTARKIADRGGRAIGLRCDVCIPADITATVDRAVGEFGGIDILVNNAQAVHLGPLLTLGDAAFAESFDSGPFATFRFMKAVYPHMKARGGGAIVNLATAGAVRWDAKGYGLYAGAKQAIRILSRAAAHEWALVGIRVNTIAPVAMTPSMDWWFETDPAGAQAWLNDLPTGRIGDPEMDIGRVVVFLVGPDARYVTGVTIPVDGGQANFG
jgi:NAD(P)-dependent dehydrogenase (short-subunit alcohol dehydrogenase family)